MSHTIELSEQAYRALMELASRKEQTPEAIVNNLIGAAARGHIVYNDVDDFFRSLGATEEEIRDAEAIHQEHERARLGAQQE